jgi:DNA-directed RNA polymerase specialized sigma24 family protein
MVRKQSAKIDPLLEPLLLPISDDEIDQFLSKLIVSHADPVIKGIISYKLHLNSHRGIGQPDAYDIHQEVILQLLAAFKQLRQEPADHPISDLRGLAAVITHRTCSRWMRHQFPERHAFKNRVHYLLIRHSAFAVWQNESKRLVAGLAQWQGRKEVAAEKQLNQVMDDEALLARIRLLKFSRQADWSGTLHAVLSRVGGPIEFDKLVSYLAAVMQLEDRPLESIDQNDAVAELADSNRQHDAEWQIEKRTFLQRLWEEVQQLPLNQRAALLLNLRDHEGEGCLALFPALGIATLRQVAEALDLEAEKLAEMWNGLPLEDSRIAELLQLTRQQVINARKSARERLTRRLKGFI